jgi:hypothetical protein
MENNITNKHITINNMKTLVDINGDDINFDIDFKVTSKNKEPFFISVVDQKTLDNQEDLEYKEVDDGFIAGNVKNTKNVYQNYFLCLKSISDSEIQCNIEIIRNTPPSPTDNNSFYDTEVNHDTHSYNNKNYYNCIIKWKWYIFSAILIFVFLYFIFYTNHLKNVLNTNNSGENIRSTTTNTNITNSNFDCDTTPPLPSPSFSLTQDIGRQFKFLYDSK